MSRPKGKPLRTRGAKVPSFLIALLSRWERRLQVDEGAGGEEKEEEGIVCAGGIEH